MTSPQCLSVPELLEAKENPDDPSWEHIQGCARCKAVLMVLPELVPEAPTETASIEMAGTRKRSELPEAIELGQLWLANGADHDSHFVVAALGQPDAGLDIVTVAPVNERWEDATDLDLRVNDGPLGYRHLISAWHHGPIFRDQLQRYLGRLDDGDAKALRQLYLRVIGAQATEVAKDVGPTVVGEDDPRREARAAELSRLRPVWQPVREYLAAQGDENEEDKTADDSRAPVVALITAAIDGPQWDPTTLCEQAELTHSQLNNFLAGSIDLTDQSDVPALARTFSALGLEYDEVEKPVRESLKLVPGGIRRGSRTDTRLAARSFADVSEEERARDIQRGVTSVDDSPEARAQAIESYLGALARELDDIT